MRTRQDSEIPKALGDELHKIYEHCGQKSTHRPPDKQGYLYRQG